MARATGISAIRVTEGRVRAFPIGKKVERNAPKETVRVSVFWGSAFHWNGMS
jgi:hypothetical protein